MSMFDFKRKISHARIKLLGSEKVPPPPLPELVKSSSPQRPRPLSRKSKSYSGHQFTHDLISKQTSLKTSTEPPSLTSASSHSEAGLGLSASELNENDPPIVTVERASPEAQDAIQIREDHSQGRSPDSDRALSLASSEQPTAKSRPAQPPRRQSLVHNSNHQIIQTLLDTSQLRHHASEPPSAVDYFTPGPATNMASIMYRKIWVKRQGASATQVQIREDDLVDDVRDAILKKYGNSLGRTFDAPDVDIKIVPRSQSQSKRPKERTLAPDEHMCRTMDAFYPGGQSMEEALVICIPQRHTPHPSPGGHHNTQHYNEEHRRPGENGNGYFPPMPAVVPSATHSSTSLETHHSAQTHDMARAMSVINTGQVPALPSPGGTLRPHNHRHIRPKATRQQTASPTMQNTPTAGGSNLPPAPSSLRLSRPHLDSVTSDRSGVPNPPPLPTPPAPEAPPTNQKAGSTPPTPNGHPNRVSSPDPGKRMKRRGPIGMSRRNGSKAHVNNDNDGHIPNISAALSPSAIDSSVPPINCLIVEDNHINLKLLEAFMKRLKVRWQTAMNGQAAVTKWRSGGFHLVLMDIQLPIMSGLEATKEIRRLERINGVGFLGTPGPKRAASHASSDENDNTLSNGSKEDTSPHESGNLDESDQLTKSTGLFKSPVIIVALTASSLQSDRHEALAAGCNDFLTKVCHHIPTRLNLLFPPTDSETFLARQLRLARAQSQGMGLHASPHRLRRLAQVEGLCAPDRRRAQASARRWWQEPRAQGQCGREDGAAREAEER